nr:insulinase family protein [uncultured Duganella sp.]
MSDFKLINSQAIGATTATVQQYLHAATGARHIHLANDDAELTFMVAFPTLPDNSDGRAHVLEHVSLCGSERFPVADPFFSMMSRSMATFMNAMTSSDFTVYPFSSTDRADFFNLLDVYLDAAFFPKLDRLSFLQEGWRHVLNDGKLELRGVVLNEMKGNFDNPSYMLFTRLYAALLPDTPYGVEVGGDPLRIPDLTHEDLLDFHARHYHPSQAVFMTCGKVDPLAVQAQISGQVLKRLGGAQPRMLPRATPAWNAPRVADLRVPPSSGRPDEYGLRMAWVLGETADNTAVMRFELMASALVGHADAPVLKALQTAGFGRPSDMLGIDAETLQIVLHLGMDGLLEAQIDAARDLILAALERAARDGVPRQVMTAWLRNTRYSQRQVTSGRDRLLAAMPIALRGGDLMAAFDTEPAARQLEAEIAAPEFFQRLVRQVLDTPMRLTARVLPDVDVAAQREAQERARLAARQAVLTPQDRARIEADAVLLQARQSTAQDLGVLPRIRPADIRREPLDVPPAELTSDGVFTMRLASNGISDGHLVFDIGALAPGDWDWLPLYMWALPQLGAAGRGYEAADLWRQGRVSQFNVGVACIPLFDGSSKVEMDFFASALREEQAQIAAVIAAWAATPRFDEFARIAFVADAYAATVQSGASEAAAAYAYHLAASARVPGGQFGNRTAGVGQLRFCAQLRTMLASPRGAEDIAARLSHLHRQIIASPRTVLCSGIENDAMELAATMRASLAGLPAVRTAAAVPAAASERTKAAVATALHIPGQINYCEAIWVVPAFGHADASALAVAAKLLTNEILHTSIRERGGAYGGGARYSPSQGSFALSSHRDPRLAGTYGDFEAGIERLKHDDFEPERLEEAIVSVLKELDRPLLPSACLGTVWRWRQQGLTPRLRQQYRAGVLSCSLDDIGRVARRWLDWRQASKAAAVGHLDQDLAGLTAMELPV